MWQPSYRSNCTQESDARDITGIDCSNFARDNCRMLTLLLLTLTVTINQAANGLMIHYPTDSKLIEVCIESEGKVDDRMNPGEYLPWWAVSCWKPFYKTEEYHFWPGAYRYKLILEMEDGFIVDGPRQIKPEEAPPDFDWVPR